MATITVDLIARTGTFDTSIARSAKDADKAFREIERVGKQMGAALGAAFAATGVAVGAAFVKATNMADDMGKAAQKIGIATDALSKLKYAADLSDVSFEQLQTGVVALTKRMAEGAEAFDAIGVSVKDSEGKLRSADAVFADVAEVFASLDDGATKTRLAFDLFGKSGTQLIPLLNSGKQGLKNFGDEAQRLGVVIDTKTAKAAENFNDNITRLKTAFDGIALQVTAQMLPAMDDLVAKFNDPDFAKGFVAIATGAATAAATVVNLISELGNLARFMGEELAARSAGPAFGDLARIEDAIARQEALIREIETTANRGMRFSRFASPADVIELQTAQKELARLKSLLVESQKAAEAAAIAAAKLGAANKGAAKDTGELSDAEKRSADLKAELEKRLKAYIDALGKTATSTATLTKATDDAEGSLRKTYHVLQDIVDPTKELNALLRQQSATLGGPAARAAAEYADELDRIADIERDLLSLGPPSLADLERLNTARGNAGKLYVESLQTGKEATEDFNRYAADATRELEGLWQNAANNIGDALTTALFDGAESGAEAIKGVMEALARDLIQFWLRQQIIIPLQQRMQGGTGNIPGFGSMVNGAYAGSSTAFGSSVFGDAAGQWFGGNTGWRVAGNIAGAVGGIYGVWDNYRNGPGGARGALSGAASGAAAGTAIFPGVGTIIGGIIGALAGFFGGADDPRIRVGDEWNDATATSRLDRVIGAQREGLPEGTATQFVNAIAEFDNMVAGILDSYSGGQEAIERIQGALANWQMSLSGDAISIEGILTGRFGVILDQFDEDVRAFVMAGETLEEQVQRLGEVLVWPEQIEGLLDQFRRAEMLSGMDELERQTLAVNEQFDALREEFEAMNATTEQLAELERFRAMALADVAESMEDVGNAAQLTAEQLEAAARSYAEFIDQFDTTGSPFQRSLRDLRRQFDGLKDEANELARAAGLAGARTQDLARIEAAFMREREAAIAGLTATVVQQIGNLYGTSAQQLESQIAAIDAELATLFDNAGSGPGFLQAFFRDMELQGQRSGLVAQLEQQRAAEEALRRQIEALDLAQNLADLTLARGISFETLAAELGLDLNRFGADLGINGQSVADFIRTLEAESLTADVFGQGIDRIVNAILNPKEPEDFIGGPGKPTPIFDDDGGKRAETDAETLELLRSIDSRLTLLEGVERHTATTATAQAGILEETRRVALVGVAEESRLSPSRLPARAKA